MQQAHPFDKIDNSARKKSSYFTQRKKKISKSTKKPQQQLMLLRFKLPIQRCVNFVEVKNGT